MKKLLFCLFLAVPACGESSKEANDAHVADAANRETGTDAALPCFSPTSNLAIAQQPGAVGCACDPAVDRDVCVRNTLAVVCMGGRWWIGVDGPCMPPPGDAAPDQGPSPDLSADRTVNGDTQVDAPVGDGALTDAPPDLSQGDLGDAGDLGD